MTYELGKKTFKEIKKILRSRSREVPLSGPFYFASEPDGGNAVLVVYTVARDPKGKKAFAEGKRLRKDAAMKGAKFCRGIVGMLGNKIFFKIESGSAKKVLVRKALKTNVGEEKTLKFLKKAMFVAPDENVEDVVDGGTIDEEDVDTSDVADELAEDLREGIDDGSLLSQLQSEMSGDGWTLEEQRDILADGLKEIAMLERRLARNPSSTVLVEALREARASLALAFSDLGDPDALAELDEEMVRLALIQMKKMAGELEHASLLDEESDVFVRAATTDGGREEAPTVVSSDDVVDKLGSFSGSVMNLSGSDALRLVDLLDLEPRKFPNVTELVLDGCRAFEVNMLTERRLRSMFPNLRLVRGDRCPGADTMRKNFGPGAYERRRRERRRADFSEELNKSKYSEADNALERVAEAPLRWMDEALSARPVDVSDLAQIVEMLGRLQKSAVTIRTTGVSVSEKLPKLEALVGERFLEWMDDPSLPESVKTELWELSERQGQVLHNAAIGKMEQLFESDSVEDKERAAQLEDRYVARLRQMYADEMEAQSEEFFGRPAEETVEEREDLIKYWERNAVLGRSWRRGEDLGPAAKLHPSYFGLFMLAPFQQEEITAIQRGRELSGTGRKSPYKLRPELNPSEDVGVEMFGGEGHTRDYYMRVSTKSHGAMTFSTKGTGLDLTRAAEADYYDGMLEHIRGARERTEEDARKGETKLRSMLVQKGDDAHATVGFGDLSMAPKDFGNFGRKLETAKGLGEAYEPLTRALTTPVSVVSMAKTPRVRELLTDQVYNRGEMPTQIVTASRAETSRRLHRVGRRDQYRTNKGVTVPLYASSFDWNIAYSNLGTAVKKGQLICTASLIPDSQVVIFKQIMQDSSDLRKAYKQAEAEGDTEEQRRLVEASRVLQERLDTVYGSVVEQEFRAEEDSTIFLASSHGSEVGSLEKGEVLYSYSDFKAELDEWDRSLDQLDLEVPGAYYSDVGERVEGEEERVEARQKTRVAYSLAYTLMGSMGVFLQEGDSTGSIGDSFEPRNVSVAVRDADEWGKGQLRRDPSTNATVTLFAKDLGDLSYSLTCVLDSAGLAHNAEDEPHAKQLVADVQVLQDRIKTVCQEFFGTDRPSGLMMLFDGTPGMGSSAGAKLDRDADQLDGFWLAMKEAGVRMDQFRQVELWVGNALRDDREGNSPREDGKSHHQALFESPEFQLAYKEATREFKEAMIAAFKNYVAKDLPEGMSEIAKLFEALTGDDDYRALTK